MSKDEIISKISELAKKHNEIDEVYIGDFKDAELLEIRAEDLIIEYCELNGYLINGFPTEKRKLSEEDLEEDYFSRERFQLYLDTLVIQQSDVADLMWHFTSSFWPDQFSSKQKYIEIVTEQVNCGVFYDIEL